MLLEITGKPSPNLGNLEELEARLVGSGDVCHFAHCMQMIFSVIEGTGQGMSPVKTLVNSRQGVAFKPRTLRPAWRSSPADCHFASLFPFVEPSPQPLSCNI